MIDMWLGSSWAQVGLVLLSTSAVFGAVILYTRIAGLRSFSKMSSFDFAMTIAVGSLLGTTAASPSITLLNGLLAVAMLFLIQIALAYGRRRWQLGKLIDNQPLLLMDGSTMLGENLSRARVSESDVWAKLREANVTDPTQILAVVFEATGDISVLHGDGPLDRGLLEGVRGEVG